MVGVVASTNVASTAIVSGCPLVCVFTSATMGFGAMDLSTVGTVMGAVIILVSARVAAISVMMGASGASLTTGATNRLDRGTG